MNFDLHPRVRHILQVVRREAPAGLPVYLVGGAVRDLLRGRPVHDLDFTVLGEIRPLARRVADALGGDFYMLDEERDTARVIEHAEDGERTFLDFCALRAPDLLADLRDRDFTVNAMACSIRQLDELIDPTGGADDLRAGRLRACGPAAMLADPVRVLRGVRQALDLNFAITTDTWDLMRAAVPRLEVISAERLRDELFRILESPRAAEALSRLDELGVLAFLLPELGVLKGVTQSPPHILDVWEHTLSLVDQLPRVWAALLDGEAGEDPALSLAAERLARFQAGLAGHFATAINPNRSLRALLSLAGLLHDAAKPASRSLDPDGRVRFFGHEERGGRLAVEIGRRLALSQAEWERLAVLVGEHMRIHHLAGAAGAPARRVLYRFFQACGPAGVDLALLSLADLRATYGPGLPKTLWERELSVAEALFAAWFEQPAQVVSPPRLLTGDELMAELRLTPGPRIGRLLAAIREAQAAGEIATRAEALEFARRIPE